MKPFITETEAAEAKIIEIIKTAIAEKMTDNQLAAQFAEHNFFWSLVKENIEGEADSDAAPGNGYDCYGSVLLAVISGFVDAFTDDDGDYEWNDRGEGFCEKTISSIAYSNGGYVFGFNQDGGDWGHETTLDGFFDLDWLTEIAGNVDQGEIIKIEITQTIDCVRGDEDDDDEAEARLANWCQFLESELEDEYPVAAEDGAITVEKGIQSRTYAETDGQNPSENGAKDEIQSFIGEVWDRWCLQEM